RDGNRWVLDRLTGERKPVFRPERAGSTSWRVVDFDPARPADLTRAATAFRSLGARPSPAATASAPGRPRPRYFPVAVASLAIALGLVVATIGPSHLPVRNPTPETPEFVLTFKALGTFEKPGLPDVAAD